MQAIEITTSPSVVSITVERAALNAEMLSRITDMLREFIPSKPVERTLTASELRRLPLHERDVILAEQTLIALHDFEQIHGGEEIAESEEL